MSSQFAKKCIPVATTPLGNFPANVNGVTSDSIKKMIRHPEKKQDLHVDLILDWLQRATIEKEKKKNESAETLPWGTVQQLNKTTWLLGAFQIVIIILFATVAGSEVMGKKLRSHNLS